MILKEDKITDRGWELLYKRLEREHLLPGKPVSKHAFFRPARFGWIAGAAVVCACICSVWFIRQAGVRPNDWVVLHNTNQAYTLATMFGDSSVVFLSGRTTIQYPPRFREDKREINLQGNAFFDINAGRPFIINTEAATVEVLGTSFRVESENHASFRLSVRSGEVKVTLKKDKQTVHVKAGETTSFESESLHLAKTGTAPFDDCFKQIHFKDERLANVVRILNMHADSVRLEITPGLENRLLTVAFSNDSPLTMATLICAALDLRHARQGNTILISKPDF
ncbi:MAG: FecR domain-containing protein [Tannerella sp.]|jgi:ferric-dicitrate binding protein FerR (iron transport regulator)|nr:FecR domain-containing protein [Tannerella sp.]